MFEEAGLCTVGISLIRIQTEKVRPPRYLFVPFPLGRPFGKPNDPAFQQQVIDAALALLKRPESDKPILKDFPVILDEEPQAEEGLACARVIPPPKAEIKDPAQLLEAVTAEIAALRPFYEESFQSSGRTMVGPSSIPAAEIERAAQYLTRFLMEENFVPPEKPEKVRAVQYLRWCIDDLKVFYQEAALGRQGDQPWTNQQLQDWLWRQTALGALILAVRSRVNAGTEAADKAVAFGMVPRGY